MRHPCSYELISSLYFYSYLVMHLFFVRIYIFISYLFLFQNTTLPLKNVSKEDRGLYKCIADNQVRPPDVYLVSLSVFFKPETLAVQDTVGQAQNRQFDAKLECRVSGESLLMFP